MSFYFVKIYAGTLFFDEVKVGPIALSVEVAICCLGKNFARISSKALLFLPVVEIST
jgi:hypothetical protein